MGGTQTAHENHGEGSIMTRLPVKIGNLVIGNVETSDNKHPHGRREETVLFGMLAIRDCKDRYHPVNYQHEKSNYEQFVSPQERFLLVVRAIATALNEGKRDEALEDDIITLAIKHYGSDIVSCL